MHARTGGSAGILSISLTVGFICVDCMCEVEFLIESGCYVSRVADTIYRVSCANSEGWLWESEGKVSMTVTMHKINLIPKVQSEVGMSSGTRCHASFDFCYLLLGGVDCGNGRILLML